MQGHHCGRSASAAYVSAESPELEDADPPSLERGHAKTFVELIARTATKRPASTINFFMFPPVDLTEMMHLIMALNEECFKIEPFLFKIEHKIWMKEYN